MSTFPDRIRTPLRAELGAAHEAAFKRMRVPHDLRATLAATRA